jgi:regulator of replication initiation timing
MSGNSSPSRKRSNQDTYQDRNLKIPRTAEMLTLEDIKKVLDEKLSGLEERLSTKLDDLVDRVSTVEEKVNELKLENEFLKKQLKARNLVIQGLPESPKEDFPALNTVVKDLFTRLDVGQPSIDEVHRLGKKGVQPRPILLKMVSTQDKFKILQAKLKIPRGENIFINEDLSLEERKAQAILRKKKREIQAQDPDITCNIKRTHLIVKKGDKIQTVLHVDQHGLVKPTNRSNRNN